MPRDGGLGICYVLGPSTIEFRAFLCAEREFHVSLIVRQAIP